MKLSAAKKGHVDAYIKLANEMRRIVEGLKNKTIVEEKELIEELNRIIDVCKKNNPLLEKIEKKETVNKESITEEQAFKIIDAISEVVTNAKFEKARCMLVGKGTKINMKEAQELFTNSEYQEAKFFVNCIKLQEPTENKPTIYNNFKTSKMKQKLIWQ